MSARVIGISGSLRRGSYNSALLRSVAALAPDSIRIEVASIEAFPLYHGDFEAEHGLPLAVSDLKERIVAADGLLIATPEYNRSLPGVLKNAIDWLSRPAKDIPRVFGGKPTGLIGATPGRGGTKSSQAAWQPVFLQALGVRLWTDGLLQIAEAGRKFHEHGAIADPGTREETERYAAGFAAFVCSAKTGC